MWKQQFEKKSAQETSEEEEQGIYFLGQKKFTTIKNITTFSYICYT